MRTLHTAAYLVAILLVLSLGTAHADTPTGAGQIMTGNHMVFALSGDEDQSYVDSKGYGSADIITASPGCYTLTVKSSQLDRELRLCNTYWLTDFDYYGSLADLTVTMDVDSPYIGSMVVLPLVMRKSGLKR